MKLFNIKKLRNKLFDTLKKIYIGDGLYLEVEDVKIWFLNYSEDEDAYEPTYEIKISYGRFNEDNKDNNNFDREVSLIDIEAKDGYDFICGMFYQYLVTNE